MGTGHRSRFLQPFSTCIYEFFNTETTVQVTVTLTLPKQCRARYSATIVLSRESNAHSKKRHTIRCHGSNVASLCKKKRPIITPDELCYRYHIITSRSSLQPSRNSRQKQIKVRKKNARSRRSLLYCPELPQCPC